MKTELQVIQQFSGQAPNECTCSTCVQMCKRVPCLGTPDDILALIDAGHVSKLERTRWAAGVRFGIAPIDMVQLRDLPGCIMLENDRCKLHAAGLKPTEGQLADCRKEEILPGEIPLNVAVAMTWTLPENMETVARILWNLMMHNAKQKATK